MREILRAYRRPDGSMHLDAATCTRYDACVISEVFRDKGGIYEATPPLFVEKPGPEQLREYDTGPDVNDVLETFREFVGDWLGFIAGEKNGFLQHAEGDARPKTLRAALGSSATTQTDSAADSAESRERRGGGRRLYRRRRRRRQGDVRLRRQRLSPPPRRRPAELAAKKRKAEAEVKATLEKAKEDAEAATGGIDWKAMRVVDDDEEAFYGTYDREKMKPKEYKYLDESAPMYESIEEADAAFEAAQKQKEADEKERAAEAAAGREAKTRAEKSCRGRRRALALQARPRACPWPSAAREASRHEVGAIPACARSGTTRGRRRACSPLHPAGGEADAKTLDDRGGRGGRPAGAVARIAPRPPGAETAKSLVAVRSPEDRSRPEGSSRWWTRTGTSARSTRGGGRLARGRRSLARSRPSVGGMFERLRRARRARDNVGSRRWARRGARATSRARARLAAGGAAVVAGAFAVTKRAGRRDRERRRARR